MTIEKYIEKLKKYIDNSNGEWKDYNTTTQRKSTSLPDYWDWEMWRTYKDVIKDNNISIAKDNDKWLLVAYRDYKASDDALQASKATTANITVPSPSGLSYLPYQLAGIAYAQSRNNTLIADAMGLGKTIQTIGLINLNKYRNVLIVCPASLKINWERELRKWITYKVDINIAGKSFPEDGIVIINYDILKKYKEEILAKTWELLVLDESHYIKSYKAQRTKLANSIHAEKVVLLTGTPVMNRPEELVTQLIRLGEKVNYFKWINTYCYKDKWGNITGVNKSALSSLNQWLRSKYMIRREKEDVLSELPPKRRQVIMLDANTPELKSVLKKEAAILKKHKNKKAELESLMAILDKNSEDYAKVAKQLHGCDLIFDELAEMRHDLGVAKLPVLLEQLDALVDVLPKIIVYAHHHDVIDAIKNHYGDTCVTLTGKQSPEDRQAAIDSFQNDDKIKIFVGSIRAAGVGITLTAANTVVFFEEDWNPQILIQCEDRCHRIGQSNSVNIYHYLIDGTIEAEQTIRNVEKMEVAQVITQ